MRGKYQVMLTHSHDFELLIPICEEVKEIYRDHSHHPKIPLYHIIIPIYITQQYIYGMTIDMCLCFLVVAACALCYLLDIINL